MFNQSSTLLSYTQCHDGVDNIIVVVFERLDGLLSRHAGLRHDKLNVLGLETRVVDLLAVIFLLLLLLGLGLLAFTLVLVGVLGGSGALSGGELLGGGGLGLGVQVLDLGLTEDAVTM